MKIIKNKLVQIVILAIGITLIYSAIGYVIWQAVLEPRTEEKDKADLQRKKRQAYYERLEKEKKMKEYLTH